MMASNSNTRDDQDSNFSFGVRELRRAKRTDPLSLDTSRLKVVSEDRGSDPYNTSGSFDRKNHWSRVGKR
jgi:hypothetical protein